MTQTPPPTPAAPATKEPRDWCHGSGLILRSKRDARSVVCRDCAQTVPVSHGVVLAHNDTKRVYRNRLNLEIAKLEVAHAEKDLALAKAKLAKALRAVRS